MVLRIEDISFIGIYINDSFRDFKDINDYANYHVSLLNNKRYQAFSGGDFIDRVVKGGYATDPNYKRALSNVYNQTQLYTLMYQLHIVKVIKFKSIDSLHDFHYLCCNN